MLNKLSLISYNYLGCLCIKLDCLIMQLGFSLMSCFIQNLIKYLILYFILHK